MPIGIMAMIALLALVAWRRGQHFWLVACLFYAITLAPVLGIVQVGSQAAADRYTYLATLPFLMLAGAGFSWWIFEVRPSRIIRWTAISGAVVITLLLAMLTRAQSDVWQTDVTLWRHVVLLDRDNAYGWFRLGDAFMLSSLPEPAVQSYRSAQALNPNHLWYGVNLPGALLALGRYQEAFDQVEILLRNDVTSGRGIDLLLVRRAEALLGLDRIDEARSSLLEALTINPANGRARSILDSL